MKYFLFILSFFFIFLCFPGCKSAKVMPVPVKTVERVTERLVPVEVPEDSSLLTALFECDSLNRVLLMGIKETKGSKVGTEVRFESGRLNYRADFKPDTVYLPSKSVEIEKEVPVITEVPVVEYRMTRLQRIFFFIGLIAATAVAVWLFLKLKLKLRL